MAAAPQWKVYDYQGYYQAACKEIEAAACLVSFYGSGAVIKNGHSKIVWIEGTDGLASQSYDAVAAAVEKKLNA